MSSPLVQVGKAYGRWTIVGDGGLDCRRKTLWLCKCQCGQERLVVASDLVRGHTKSCGCLSREMLRASRVTHGESKRGHWTAEYVVWMGIRARCLHPQDASYPRYGGRGIRMCERWRRSFAAFLADVGRRPSSAHSLDRYPNNDGHYEPGNVRWATLAEQSRNRRTNRFVRIGSRTMCVTDWVRHLGIPKSTFYARLKRGMSVEEAFCLPAVRATGGEV